MAKVSFYVDGFNLYHAISKLQRPELKWLNLRVLASSFLEKQDTLVSVTYFTAPMVWNADKYQRHREYITALIAQRVAVVESRFLKSKKFCNGFFRYCDFYEEKQTDVAFAVRVLPNARCPRRCSSRSNESGPGSVQRGLPSFRDLRRQAGDVLDVTERHG